MKIFKKITAGIIAGAAMFALAAAVSAEGGVAVDETNFPDEVFRNYVSENFDTDKSGDLSEEEINGVTKISISGTYSSRGELSDLTGIEYFTALRSLGCGYNQLTSLDVSKNTALTIWIAPTISSQASM